MAQGGVTRIALAAVLDSAVAALAAFAGFRLALAVVPCDEISECPILTPLIVLGVIVLVGAYFALGFALWKDTPARGVLGLAGTSPD